MKKYNSLFKNREVEDNDLYFANLHEKDYLICGEDLFEAVIHPENYINNLIDLLDKNVFKKNSHPEDIINILSKIYKSHKIEFKVFSHKGDEFIFGASTNKNIIYIYCSSNITDVYNNFEKFKEQFKKFLKHEIIHREQFNRINNEKIIKNIIQKSRENQIKYLSSKQEIMAYAWQIVYDFRISGKSDKIISQLINKDSFFATKYSKILTMYKEFFKKDSDILKRLYKYIYEYLKI